MEKILRVFSIALTLLIAAIYFDNGLVVNAENSNLYPLSIEFNVYTDIANAEENTVKGGFITVYGETFVEINEEWVGKETILSKVKPMVESLLKNKTGKNYSVVSLIKTPDAWAHAYARPLDKNSRVNGTNNFEDVNIRFIDRRGFINGDNYKILINVFASEAGPLNGWHLFGGAERYYSNNQFNTGLRRVGQTTYLFDKYGAKQYGWNVVQGWSMYFNEENGGLWTGKRKIGQTTYLFNNQGHKIDGWHRLNGKDYYFNKENGGMWTGKRTIGRTTYLLHNDGYKIHGWHVDRNGEKYYFDPNFGGGMITSLRRVGNAYYYFDISTGRALRNRSRIIGNQNWYFNDAGVGTVIK